MDKTLRQLFELHNGKLFDKWSLYLDEWDSIYGPYRNQPIQILEIGIQNGGSLEIWAKYFQKAKKIIGCDIDHKCEQLRFDDTRIEVVVGDPNLDTCEDRIMQQATTFNIIIDDGSHKSSDTIRSFARYFPHLNDDGIYVMEDLHSSYWKNFEGGLHNPRSTISFLKRLTDIVNYEHWRNNKSSKTLLTKFSMELDIEFDELELLRIHSIEFINSLCVIKKKPLENNLLGKRLIVGTDEYVTVGAKMWNNSNIQDFPEEIEADGNLDVFELITEKDKNEQTLARYQNSIHFKNKEILNKQAQFDAISQSRYWQTGEPIRRIGDFVKRVIRVSKNIAKLPFHRAWKVLLKQGLRFTFQVFKERVRFSPGNVLPILDIKAVFILSGCPGDAMRYRCIHKMEQLQFLGCMCDVGTYGIVNLVDILERYHFFILHRVPMDQDVDYFIKEAQLQGKPVIFDTDDLVFTVEVIQHVAAIEDMTEADCTLFIEGLDRYQKTMVLCDAVIVTTEALRNQASRFHDRIFVVPNTVNQEMCDHADSALFRKAECLQDNNSDVVTIGYLSGTATHNRDFLEAADSILWALQNYPFVRFKAVGHLKLDSRFQKFEDRIDRIPLMAWQNLPELISTLDINIAPLEPKNPFTDSKSCLKYLEAGLLGVPTIASSRNDFNRVIEHNINGMLVDSKDQWQDAIRCLIEFPALRKEIGRCAYEDVRRNHTTKAQSEMLYQTLRNIVTTDNKDFKALTINWILRAPIAGTGGGYRTIFRLANYLGNKGHRVRVYVEKIAHLEHLSNGEVIEFVEENFGPLQVDVAIGFENILPADISIATNWPTAYHVANHGASLYKAYFIQDYEPEFYDENDANYLEAEKTYSLPLKPICIGQYLTKRIAVFTGKTTETIDFALDTDVFHMKNKPDERSGSTKILFFARPGLKRRGYELGIEALSLVKQQHPDVEIFFFGALDQELGVVPFEYVNFGVLTPDALSKIMNEVHILLCFSLSNISWVPFEGMACGAAVVEANVPSVQAMVDAGRTCLLADINPQAVADALLQLVDDKPFRCEIAIRAAGEMQHRTWKRSAEQFEHILQQQCFVRLT